MQKIFFLILSLTSYALFCEESDDSNQNAHEFTTEPDSKIYFKISTNTWTGGKPDSVLSRLPRNVIYAGAEKYQCKKYKLDLETAEGIKEAKRRLDEDKRLRKKLRKRLGKINGKSPLEIKINRLYEQVVSQEGEKPSVKDENFDKKAAWVEKETLKNYSQQVSDEHIQNFREIFLAHKNYESIKAFHEKKEIVRLGEKQLDFLEIALEDEDYDQLEIYRQRVNSIIKTIQDNFSQNHIEQNIRNQNSEIIKQSSELKEVFNDFETVKNISDVVLTTAQAVSVCNQEGEYEQSYSLIDFASSILNAGKASAKFMFLATKGVVKGTWDSSVFIATLAANLATSPVKTSTKIVSAVAGITEKIVRASWLAIADSDEFVHKISDKINNFEEKFSNLSYEEKIVETSKFATELFFPIAATKLRILEKMKKVSKTVGFAVRSEIKAAKALGPSFHQVVSPLKIALSNAFETVKNNFSSFSYGTKITAKKTAQKVKFRWGGSRQVIDVYDKVIDCKKLVNANSCWNPRSLLHVCKGNYLIEPKAWLGNFRKGLKTGMHTENGFRNFIKTCNFDMSKVEIMTFKNGVKIVKLPKEYFAKNSFYESSCIRIKNLTQRIEGAKTLWPASYTPVKINDSIKEIIGQSKNFVIKNKKGFLVFEGIDKNGITARVVLDENYIVKTAFPLIK